MLVVMDSLISFNLFAMHCIANGLCAYFYGLNDFRVDCSALESHFSCQCLKSLDLVNEVLNLGLRRLP